VGGDRTGPEPEPERQPGADPGSRWSGLAGLSGRSF